MTTTKHPEANGQAQARHTQLGFALSDRQRLFCLLMGVALMGYACYSADAHGPNTVAVLGLAFGFALLVAGLVGRFGRFTFDAPGIGARGSYEPDYAPSALKEPLPEQVAPPPPAPDEGDPTRRQIEVSDQGTGSDAVKVEKREPFADALTALNEKDYSKFDSKMLEAIDSETDEDRKVALKAYRLERLYSVGQTGRMAELQALRQQYPESPYPVIQLGDCYDLTGENVRAAKLYKEGYDIPSLTGDQRVRLLSRQAGALQKAKLFEEAESCLTKGLERADTDVEKAEVEKLLAQLYKDWGKKDEMLMHFDKAVELSPGDVDGRFELAYGYSDEGYELAALHHYDRLRVQRDGPAELNNLAIILSELDMPIAAARFYRRAANQGSSLAAANLARIMLRSGLVEEARRLLAEALKQEEVDAAVHRASAAIPQREETEEKRLERIEEAAAAERSLLVERFELERQDLNPVRVEDIEGTWQTSVGDMTFKQRDTKLVAGFKDGIWGWELTGEVSGRTYSFGWTCERTSQNQEGDGFFIFRTDGEFEGIIRHTPAKGEVKLVNGGQTKPSAAPEKQADPQAQAYESWRRRGGQG